MAESNAYQLQNLSLNTSYEEENVHVSECDAKFYADHLENRGEVYPIEACIPKAYVLILNNHEGIKEGQERPGSEKDVALMEKLWKGFQCNVKVERNQTAKEMDQTLKDFSNNTIHESCDFCVVIIMSHASFRNPSIVTGTDGKYIETNTVLELFRDRPHLNGKPKLIFFQSCRGEHKAEKLNPKKSYTKIIPSSSDILVVYSTTEDDMSFREEATGSWFINAIARVFSNKARTEHVADMLTEVGNKVSQINPDGDRQMSEFASTLRKKLYLFPGFPKTQK